MPHESGRLREPPEVATQKVEGSKPFSRFEKGLQIDLFPLRRARLTF
jgi:hypothetical protein